MVSVSLCIMKYHFRENVVKKGYYPRSEFISTFYFPPFKRNAAILILTKRHLVHALLFMHRVPPRLHTVKRVGCIGRNGNVCQVATEWRSLAN